ncbi:UNVERIFIED_CONTAM: hypothetical protein HDU68_003656 [Siphonaria sp. JEL0065]|nr:hypothetical protein HDU68_003656 [Siphonaria sp. JEL0065]
MAEGKSLALAYRRTRRKPVDSSLPYSSKPADYSGSYHQDELIAANTYSDAAPTPTGSQLGGPFKLISEAMPSVLLALGGLMLAGTLLDALQKWTVFIRVPELFILVPTLLGLKGNLEMNLASRLSTASNMGLLDKPVSRYELVIGNMALLQVQSACVSGLASAWSLTISGIVDGTWLHAKETALICAAGILTASVASLMLGNVMCGTVVVCRILNMDPDNIATPVAASLGDLITLLLLAAIATGLNAVIDSSIGVLLIVFSLSLLPLCDLAMLLFANAASATPVRVVLVPNTLGNDSDSDGFEMLSDSDNDLVDVASNGSEHRIVKSTLLNQPEQEEEHRDVESESAVESLEAVYDHMLDHEEIQATEQMSENPFHDPVMDALIESVSKSVLLEFPLEGTSVGTKSVIPGRTLSAVSLELGASAFPEHGATAIVPISLGATVAEPFAFGTAPLKVTLGGLEIVDVQPIEKPEFIEPASTNHEEFAPKSSLNVNDALSYLNSVKTEFHNQPKIDNQFLDVMKDFKAQTIDTPQVMERDVSLFEGHPTGFNTLLPPGYSMPTPEIESDCPASAASTPTIDSLQGSRPAINFSSAVTYVHRVKTHFICSPNVYHEFLDILQVYQREKLPLAQVNAKVKVLFEDAPDLLEQFKDFLPDMNKQDADATSTVDTEESVSDAGDFEAVATDEPAELAVPEKSAFMTQAEPISEKKEPSSTIPPQTSSEYVDEAAFFYEEISPLLDTLLCKIEANPQVIPLLIQRIPETLSGYNFGLSIEGADGRLLGTTLPTLATTATTPSTASSHTDTFAQRMAEHETAMAAHREHMIRHQEHMKAHWLRVPPEVPTAPEDGSFFPPGFPFPTPPPHHPYPPTRPPHGYPLPPQHHGHCPPPPPPGQFPPPHHRFPPPPPPHHGYPPPPPHHGHPPGHGCPPPPPHHRHPPPHDGYPPVHENAAVLVTDHQLKVKLVLDGLVLFVMAARNLISLGFATNALDVSTLVRICFAWIVSSHKVDLLLPDFCENCFKNFAIPHATSHKFYKLSGWDDLFKTVSCDGCDIRSIVGIRHKCTECPNYDLCSQCIGKAAEIHPNHSFESNMLLSQKHIEPICRQFSFSSVAMTMNSSTSTPVVTTSNASTATDSGPAFVSAALTVNDPAVVAWKGVVCNGCHTGGFLGARYKCSDCSDYDLCSSCFNNGIAQHADNHRFYKLTSWEGIHKTVFCDGCKTRGIVGDRQKCTVCPDFDLCRMRFVDKDRIHPGHEFVLNACKVSSSIETRALEYVATAAVESGEERAVGYKWNGVTCDGCGTETLVGKRYRCEECADFGESHNHSQFVELESFDQMHRRVACNGCHSLSIVGPRYTCADCPYDLCSKCLPLHKNHTAGHWFNRVDLSPSAASTRLVTLPEPEVVVLRAPVSIVIPIQSLTRASTEFASSSSSSASIVSSGSQSYTSVTSKASASTATMPGSFPVVNSVIPERRSSMSVAPVAGDEVGDYALQQITLYEMGFMNPNMNLSLLKKHNGDMVVVAEELVKDAEAQERIVRLLALEDEEDEEVWRDFI